MIEKEEVDEEIRQRTFKDYKNYDRKYPSRFNQTIIRNNDKYMRFNSWDRDRRRMTHIFLDRQKREMIHEFAEELSYFYSETIIRSLSN